MDYKSEGVEMKENGDHENDEIAPGPFHSPSV